MTHSTKDTTERRSQNLSPLEATLSENQLEIFYQLLHKCEGAFVEDYLHRELSIILPLLATQINPPKENFEKTLIYLAEHLINKTLKFLLNSSLTFPREEFARKHPDLEK